MSDLSVSKPRFSFPRLSQVWKRLSRPVEQNTNTPGGVTRAYVVSDVHLNNHDYDRAVFTENPRRRHFRSFLTHINDQHQDRQEKLVLVLNGDILDITGSWFEPVLPWDENPKQVERSTINVLNQILENNAAIVAELKRFLAFKNTELYYVVGNHEMMLNRAPATKTWLQDQLTLSQESKARFHVVNTLELKELGLYAEHGHALDGFNSSDKTFPIGDYVNIIVINRFVDRVAKKLAEHQYSPQTIQALRHHLHEIEYIRPLALLPLWIETTARQYQTHPENRAKSMTIDQIIQDTYRETFNLKGNPAFAKRLKEERAWMTLAIPILARYPGSVDLMSRAVSSMSVYERLNQSQMKHAQTLYQQKGYRFITMGHTHKSELTPLAKDAYYFNTGGWKPVVYLYRPRKNNPFSAALPLEFNKVENSVVLKIETGRGQSPNALPHYTLSTLQADQSSFHP